MRFTEFRQQILDELNQNPEGLTWVEIKERLGLPYQQPCPTWVNRMEVENGLTRARGTGRAYVWKVEKDLE
jgi:hypothetical protein